MGKGYGQFCPISKAAEVLCERWNPLILRELMSGSNTFNAIGRGVPLMSRALLTKRLKELEKTGVLYRRDKETGQGSIYELTEVGEALRPVIGMMGKWAQQWGSDRVAPEDLDDALMMWSMRRRFDLDSVPTRKIVLQFDIRGLTKTRKPQRSWWVILENRRVDVGQQDPGFCVDATISADLAVFTHVLMGFASLANALKQKTIYPSRPPSFQLPNILPAAVLRTKLPSRRSNSFAFLRISSMYPILTQTYRAGNLLNSDQALGSALMASTMSSAIANASLKSGSILVPASAIKPSSINRRARSLLSSVQLLFRLRGVKR